MAVTRSLNQERISQSDELDIAGKTESAKSLPRSTRSGLDSLVEEVELLERTPEYAISTWRGVMFLAWRGAENAKGIARSRILMAPWAERRQRGVVLIILMPSTAALAQPPSDEARATMADVSRNASDSLKGIGIIGNVGGFVGAVVRSVMTARQALVRTAIPFKMFSSPEEAAPWVAQRLEARDMLRHDFVSAVENARWK